jgi:Secretion system C-terminal sorting domain
MNSKRIILLSFLMLQMITLFSQSVAFTYDGSGNRITRTITVKQQSQTVEFPVVNPKDLDLADAKGTEVAKEAKDSEDGKIAILVYPNPNKGILKIEISNMPLNSIIEMRLYDLSGLELTVNRNSESHSEIDISQFRDGVYILRIKINEKTFDWKVIKNNE